MMHHAIIYGIIMYKAYATSVIKCDVNNKELSSSAAWYNVMLFAYVFLPAVRASVIRLAILLLSLSRITYELNRLSAVHVIRSSTFVLNLNVA